MTTATGNIVIAGGGGFIGGHLARSLLDDGYERVRVIDTKPLDQWYQVHSDAENLHVNLADRSTCVAALDGADSVYDLAADMGGIGFIENNRALCMMSIVVGSHLVSVAAESGVRRFFFSSSACVYAADKQGSANVKPLKEEDAYPAMPEDGYGWEKLFMERLCRHFWEDFGLETRVARYHNVYGPYGTWSGGREKAPAAICRKVAEAKLTGRNEIEIWGDGRQTRSFMYIDDCVLGTRLLMESDVNEPLNLGSDQLVTINELVDIVEDIASVSLRRTYLPDAPQGVRGRNSDNTRISERLGWAPSVSLQAGLEQTYRWVHDQVACQLDRTTA